MIVGFGAFLLAGAFAAENLAAQYIAVFGTWIAYVAHAIEVRLNKLLDQNNVLISAEDLDR